MTLPFRTILLVAVVSMLLALPVDRLLVTRYVPGAVNAVMVKPGFVALNVPLAQDATMGGLSLLIMPIVVGSVAVLPFRSLRQRAAWVQAWRNWRSIIIIFLVVVPVGMVLGGFVYSLIKSSLPGPASAALESTGFKPTLYLWNKDTHLAGPFDTTVGSLAGLLAGLGLGHLWLRG
jgi:hypothetical protein